MSVSSAPDSPSVSIAPSATPVASKSLPLAVDLDGTLLKTDLLWEAFLAVIRQNIFLVFWIPLWLVHGKARLKHELARMTKIDVSLLPVQAEFVSFLRSEHQRGRTLLLTTAADNFFAQSVAGHLGIFSEVLASNGKLNLKGKRKSGLLINKLGEKGFDYAGNDTADLTVWSHASAAVVVNAPRRLVSRVRRVTDVVRIFDDRKNRLQVLVRALRVNHWIKNLLVFVPLLTSHRWTDLPSLLSCGLAFLAFSLVASSVYVLNDLCDLQNDRIHAQKKQRPFAAGDLSIKAGLLIIPMLLLLSLVFSWSLPGSFVAILVIYGVLNVAYSLYLKQVILLDVLMLAVFYAMRVSAGGTAAGIVISHWLLIFSVFIFMSLASGKRASELYELRKKNRESAMGRGYSAGDLEQVASQGTASGYMAVLVLALYIYSPEVMILYKSPHILWLVCPILLYWISRFWLLVHRGKVQEDPLVFVTKDKVSFLVGLLTILVMLAAKQL